MQAKAASKGRQITRRICLKAALCQEKAYQTATILACLENELEAIGAGAVSQETPSACPGRQGSRTYAGSLGMELEKPTLRFLSTFCLSM